MNKEKYLNSCKQKFYFIQEECIIQFCGIYYKFEDLKITFVMLLRTCCSLRSV